MDKLKLKRKPIRSNFTKTFNCLMEKLKQPEVDVDSINIDFAKLERLAEEKNALDQEILELVLELNDEEKLNDEYNEIDFYKDKFDIARVKVNSILNQVHKSENASSAHSVAVLAQNGTSLPNQRKLKLPKLELKQFSGEVKDWLGFWSQFSRIHNDKELPLEDKYQYLIQVTVPRSRARIIVDSYPPTAENYEKAINSLKARFGREELLTEFYVRELLNIVVKNMCDTQSKTKVSTVLLYDKLESHLRALESIGMTQDKFAAMLFPLVESCIPENLLRVWLRSSAEVSVSINDSSTGSNDSECSYANKLQKLMTFLKVEVEGEERINMAKTGFKGFDTKPNQKVSQLKSEETLPTACSLVATKDKESFYKKHQGRECLFCDKPNHGSRECFNAQKMTHTQKMDLIKGSNGCYICLKQGHISKACKAVVKCLLCHRRHCTIMCPNLNEESSKKTKSDVEEMKYGCNEEDRGKDKVGVFSHKESANLNTQSCSNEVLLQTVMVKLRNKQKSKVVRALIDGGSQRSYILESTVREMGFEPNGKEVLIHSLFGGAKSEPKTHNRFIIPIESIEDEYKLEISVLDQTTICGSLPRLSHEVEQLSLIKELMAKDIKPTDIGDEQPEIEILIGADAVGDILTEKYEKLECGLVAMKTLLGWIVFGKRVTTNIVQQNSSMGVIVTDLFTQSRNISDLWTLDTLGINDPYEVKSKEEKESLAIEHFKSNIYKNKEGRYEIKLPWVESQDTLKNNKAVAEKRLLSTTEKLKKEGLFEDYQKVFDLWEETGIISEVKNEEDNDKGYYLPHHAVVKTQSSTKIRPVFDASSKAKGCLSLNDCLEKGPNLIEEIPSVLIRFREHRIGVTSDIEKAFLQISVDEPDRTYLKFLWWADYEKRTLKIYQHCRVVFGVNCSPFILGASINHLLETYSEEYPETSEKLKKSYYVDNCVASVDNEIELQNFTKEAIDLMSKAKFNLRDWKFSGHDSNEPTSVLGLLWDTKRDTLSCSTPKINIQGPVTRRTILSMVHKVFDPIGFTCPVTLHPKLLLQTSWKKKLSWDEEVPQEIRKNFLEWSSELYKLSNVKIPRFIGGKTLNNNQSQNISLHTFCDASKNAFSAVVYIRSEFNGNVQTQMVMAKSRVAPLKEMTIPRLELMACCIGSRLALTVTKSLDMKEIAQYYWTDSTTVLWWIKNEENWSTFVQNRVSEIRKITNGQWNHVAGVNNPADLPSRGCSIQSLVDSHWWEGPKWLSLPEANWPISVEVSYDKTQVDQEQKKKSESVAMLNCKEENNWYLNYFSKYSKVIRMAAWIFRFANNTRKQLDQRARGELTVQEIDRAEKALIIQVQKDMISDKKTFNQICTFQDKDGIYRIKTKISYRRGEEENFRYPIVLPNNHKFVKLLIVQKHEELCHAGTNILMSALRERFWIIKARRMISGVIKKCVKCKRHSSKPLQTSPVALPEDRTRQAKVFEVTGVDLAGPLILKNKSKAWIVIFTCAIYRAIHLELITSLSTSSFMLGLRRFIARRGRPTTIYSDNGTNFVGTENFFKSIDWNCIERESTATRIQWKFIPPTAAWWGGWWERLIQMIKNLLKRVLGRASLDYEELFSIICDCEAVVNARPLTYMSDESGDLITLTPAMFLQEVQETGVPDLDTVDNDLLPKRFRYQQHLREELRKRFRIEYLSQLILKPNKKESQNELEVGDIVLLGSDGRKRLDWPLARIIKMYPGKDGKTRVVKLKTSAGEFTRPIQRVYPLEVKSSNSDEGSVQDELIKTAIKRQNNEEMLRKTSCGRQVKVPQKLLDYEI